MVVILHVWWCSSNIISFRRLLPKTNRHIICSTSKDAHKLRRKHWLTYMYIIHKYIYIHINLLPWRVRITSSRRNWFHSCPDSYYAFVCLIVRVVLLELLVCPHSPHSQPPSSQLPTQPASQWVMYASVLPRARAFAGAYHISWHNFYCACRCCCHHSAVAATRLRRCSSCCGMCTRLILINGNV